MALPKFLVGISDSVKNFYYTLENKWYDLLDWLDPKIPVYKVIDPIDKVIPSFILFLLFILFLIILATYLIKFSSPYEFVFNVADSTSGMKLSGVILSGSINEKIFEEKTTNSSGETKVLSEGPKYNIYEMFGAALFGIEEEFIAQITTQKDGYENWDNKDLSFKSKKAEILLNKLPDPPKPPETRELTIELYDEDSFERIYDESGLAYIEYECENRFLPTGAITITDADDGALDGVFTILQTECNYKITKASAPGYVPLGVSVTIDTRKSKEKVYLKKQPADEGTASVFVYRTINGVKQALPNILVKFNKIAYNLEATTNSSGIANKVLPSGEYFITIEDTNYYSITLDSNKKITITKGKTSELAIELIYMPPENRRIVYFKVVDSNNEPIKNAIVELIQLYTDENNNYYAVNPKTNNQYYFPLRPNTTDINGLFKKEGFSNISEKVLAVITKPNYYTKFFIPKFLNTKDNYEIVTMEEGIANSSATIKVKEKDNNQIVFGANAHLLYYTIIDGIEISHIPIKDGGKKTDIKGEVTYTSLNPGNYAASADLDGHHASGVTEQKTIDSNEHKEFEVFLNLNGSILSFKLIDQNNNSQIQGNVEINYINSAGDLTLIENVPISAVGITKSSLSYKKNSDLYIVASSTSYSTAFLFLNGSVNNLKVGDNFFEIALRPKSSLDPDNGGEFDQNTYTIDTNNLCLTLKGVKQPCRLILNSDKNISDGIITSDKNCVLLTNDYSIRCTDNVTYKHSSRVNVFFNEVYSINDDLTGPSTANSLDSDKEYVVSMDAVIDGNTTYQELLSMMRINGPAEVKNVVISSPPRKQNNKFSCNFNLLDNIIKVKENNYYFPINDCGLSKNIMSGFTWSKTTIPKGTYTFETYIKVDSNSDGNLLNLQFRSKEKDTIGSTETLMFTKEFIVGEIYKPGIYFDIESTSNNEKFTLNETDSQDYNIKLDNNIVNTVKIQITNNTSQNLSNATLTAYSHLHLKNSFDPAGDGSGDIFFNESKTLQKKNIATGINLGTYQKTGTIDLNMYMNEDKSSWLVLVLSVGNTPISTIFIQSNSSGALMKLKDACFLAGINKQNFTLSVMPKIGVDPSLKISSATLRTYKNCSTSNLIAGPINLGEQDSDSLSVLLEGYDYNYNSDCLTYSIYGKSDNYKYSELTGTIKAGSCGTIDPTLTCIGVDIDSGPTSDIIKMDWNSRAILRVINNNCDGNIEVILESGLICKVDGKDCSESVIIPKESTKEFEIKTINLSYNPSLPKPNFSDIIGYYPIYVKAKLSNNVRKKYSIVRTVELSVGNSKECFAIEKDYFDFLEETNQSVLLRNDCQYTLIGNYYIPRVNLYAFGYDLNLDKPNYYSTQFKPSIVVKTDGQYSMQTITETSTTYGQDNTVEVTNGVEIDGRDYYLYKNLHFDLNNEIGLSDKIQVRFIDINNYLTQPGYPAINKPYGAAIDGRIKVTYIDDSIEYIDPVNNFNIETHPKCIGTCEIGSELGADDIIVNEPGNPFVFGLVYLNLPSKKDIKYIDFNIIGNKRSSILEINVKAHLETTNTYERLVYSADANVQRIYLTDNNLEILALEGIDFVVKRLNELENLKQTGFVTSVNPEISLESENPFVTVWIQGDLLMARFIGKDVDSFNDGTIEGTIIKNFGQGKGLGIIEVTDYVNPASGKIISGR
ncbi:MAG TPA: hypothetical protein PKK60_00305 [archaeon]|nr:hypothetical protein [archaeon]